jgi:RHS repeat-associated protein
MESFSIQYSNYNGTNYLYAAAYYPLGMSMPGTTHNYGSGYRWGYQGQYAERDSETGLSAFMLRQYDGRIGRWTTIDPYGQYWSPYLGMGNNPVVFVDSDGRWAQLIAKHGLPAIFGLIKGATSEYIGQVVLNLVERKDNYLTADIKTSQIMISAGQGFFKGLAGSFSGKMASGIADFGTDIYSSFAKGVDAARIFSIDNPNNELETAAIFLSTTIVEFTFNNLISQNLKIDKDIHLPQLERFFKDIMVDFLMDLNSKFILQAIGSTLNRGIENSTNAILQNKFTRP